MMTTSKKKRWVALSTLAAVVVGVGIWYFTAGSSLPVVMAAPAYTLDNLEGKKVSSTDPDQGKVRLVEFMYTHCPDICPMTTANMVQVQKKLKDKGVFGKKVEFVSVTFDGTRDTPDVLKAYADTMGADLSGWTFLRGPEDEVAKIMSNFGAYVEKQPDGSFAHTTDSLYLVDKKNNVRKVYHMGQDMEPTDEVYKDIVGLT